MSFFVYILKSDTKGRYYIGSCEDKLKRLEVHNSGLVRSTKYGIPWKMVYSEEYSSRSESRKREAEVKRYKGGQAFKKLVQK